MPIIIRCSDVHVSKEDWGCLIAWGDDKGANDRYLMLQAADSYDEQDVRLGMDDVYIECCGQGWSWYGHIDSFQLSRNRVDVTLNEAAAKRMSNDGRIAVEFVADDKTYERLRDALRKVFSGCKYFTEV